MLLMANRPAAIGRLPPSMLQVVTAFVFFWLSQNPFGTGGNGAALRHFQNTGKKYPLVVKLGTITPSGADVYSYADDEDDMVLDPHLDTHLRHWGINMLQVCAVQ